MVIIIVAYDSNKGIGLKNDLPWHFSEDLKWVAETTKKTIKQSFRNAIVMGRNTWESIPSNRRPLKGRLNIVISSKLEIENPDVLVFTSFQKFVQSISQINQIETFYIFGGETIYKQALDVGIVDEILATEINFDYHSDTFFPLIPNTYERIVYETTYYDGIEIKKTRYKKIKE